MDKKRWLLSGLSFLITTGESERVWKSGDIPDWFVRLHKAGCKQVWLAGVAASQVGTFLPSVARVGLFLNFMDRKASQPDPEWFCTFHISVWYLWSNYDVTQVRETGFANLIPPPHKLQAVTMFMTPEPSAVPAPLQHHRATAPNPPATASNPPAKNKPPAWKV
jgi:hypothetical protein